jgi:hypothetical protein
VQVTLVSSLQIPEKLTPSLCFGGPGDLGGPFSTSSKALECSSHQTWEYIATLGWTIATPLLSA